MQRQLQELQADRDAAKEEADDLADQIERLLEENGSLDRERSNLLSLLDTERSHSTQLQQQLEELEEKLASVPPMTAPDHSEHKTGSETEQIGSELEGDRTELFSPTDLAKMFPNDTPQNFRDWAKSMLNGGSNSQGFKELKRLNLELVEIPQSGLDILNKAKSIPSDEKSKLKQVLKVGEGYLFKFAE